MTDQKPFRIVEEPPRDLLLAVGAAQAAALSCWSAGISLKSAAGEGGLTEEQAALTRGWKSLLLSAAVQHLIKVAELSEVSAGEFVSTMLIPSHPGHGKFSLELVERLHHAELDGTLGLEATAAADGGSIAAPGGLGLMTRAHPGAGLESVCAEYRVAEAAGDGFDPVRPSPAGSGSSGGRVSAIERLSADTWQVTLLLLARLAHADPAADGTPDLVRTIDRLLYTVLRPLGEALARMPALDVAPAARPAGSAPETERPIDEILWQLAVTATALRPSPGEPAEILEAVAGLQDLSCRLAPAAGAGNRAERIAELRRLQDGAPAGIEPAPNGPYLVTNVDDIEDWLGVAVSTPPQVALCRCGASGAKPFCDGSHARTGFTDAKSPSRLADRRDTYPGLQAGILDNRGTCAHSGFCTDRLSSVFRLRQEPFVLPSGGRLDEIVQAVRSCPSGALSLAIGDQETRDVVDQDRGPAIEISKDGPYRVTGRVPLTDRRGDPYPRNQGASHEHYSLCRCGQSQNKPFCSGMHWYVDFHDPVRPDGYEPTIFEWAGGLPAFRRMTAIFYAKYVPQDELLSRLFADMRPDHPERVAAWLSEVFGGPPTYSEQYGGYPHMISEHVGRRLTESQRTRWAHLMAQAADDAGMPTDAEFRAAFISYIEWGTRIAVENSQQDAHPPASMTVPRWWWVCDATPGARISALAPAPAVEEAELPGADVELSFERHIRPLFRSQDRNSMKFVFDLWTYEDVRDHAEAIRYRLREGSMPCDGAWESEKVQVFSRWVDAGTPR